MQSSLQGCVTTAGPFRLGVLSQMGYFRSYSYSVPLYRQLIYQTNLQTSMLNPVPHRKPSYHLVAHESIEELPFAHRRTDGGHVADHEIHDRIHHLVHVRGTIVT